MAEAASGTGASDEVRLGADEARRLQLRAQGFLGARPKGGVPAMLERLGAVQLDTISVLARSHELVPYARLGPVKRAAIEAAYWGNGTRPPNRRTLNAPGQAEHAHPKQDQTKHADAEDSHADAQDSSVMPSGAKNPPGIPGQSGCGGAMPSGAENPPGITDRSAGGGAMPSGAENPPGITDRSAGGGVMPGGGDGSRGVSGGGVSGGGVSGGGVSGGGVSGGGVSGGSESGRGRGGSGSFDGGGGGFAAFEYWAHAASVIPMGDWPLFAFRRRAYLERGWRWHKVPEGVCDDIRARLKADGPLTTKELGGAKASAEWWDWSDHKIGIEWLLDIGEVVCVERVGWRRVYDLAERAVPPELLEHDLDDDACLTALVARAGRALGVATRADLADYYRLKQDQVDRVIEATGLVPARVDGWSQRAWADPEALSSPPRGRHATTLLSPFDSLVWDRARASRVFGFDHRLEAYVPKGKRVHGYFAMPLLAGGRLIGRVDPAREGRTLIARQASLEPWATRTAARTETSAAALATALWKAAAWVGCDDVRIERTPLPATVIESALKTTTPP